MRKISNPVKIILLLLITILFLAGCNVRLATKEDWKTAAPEKSAAGTAAANGTPCVTPDSENQTLSVSPDFTVSAAAGSTVSETEPAAVPTAVPMPTAQEPQATAAKPTDIRKTEPPKTESPATAKPTATPVSKQNLTVSIEGPEGMILSRTQLQYGPEEKKTVFDLTMDACNNSGIAVTYTGSAKRHTIYIQGIGGIFEKDYGGSSGWIYFVNGAFPSINVSSYVLKDGDIVEWQYTR